LIINVSLNRFLRILKSLVRNKAHPEGSIAEGIIARECLTFCSRYIQNYEMQSNEKRRNHVEDSSEYDSTLTIFKQSGSPLKGVKKFLSMSEWKMAIMCVLKNCINVLPFIG
jgi:Domain of unknown function (DUF4218)